MVIELKEKIQNTLSNHTITSNGTPPRCGVGDEQKSKLNQQLQSQTKDQSLMVKSNIPEVTFCNLSDTNDSSYGTLCEHIRSGGNKGRKRLISSNDGDSADSIDSSSLDRKKSQIPDGGYGWVVVFASLCVSLIADGISFSFGLIYNELLLYFQESKSKTAWIGSLFLAVPLLLGPVMSNLVDKYGCRRMTIIGGMISSLGFGLASISNSVEMLYLTFGVISGLGLGIGYVTAVVSVAFWFDKKRTFATGIGASGTGVGTFLYAPFTQWLLETFGWRGATLILAGTMLNTCVFGCLMRDPDWLIEENRLESRTQSMTTFSNSSVNLDEIRKLLENGANKESVLDTLVTNVNTEANQNIHDPDDMRAAKKYNSEIFLPTFLGSNELDSFHGIRYESRRSLRRKHENEIVSKEDLLSSTTNNENHEKTSLDKNRFLASTETLSPSEKVSTKPNTPVRLSVPSLITLSDEGYLTSQPHNNSFRMSQKSNNPYNSRLSLNESAIAKAIAGDNPDNDSLRDFRHSFRGNSLDILYEGQTLLNNNNNNNNSGTFLKSSDSLSRTAPAIIDGGGVIIPINDDPKITSNRKQQRKRQVAENLRRNISIRHSNFLKNMRVHRNSIHYRGAMLNTHRYRLRASSCPNIYRNSMTTIARDDDENWYDNFVDIMKSIFDFSLFLEPKFALFNLSTLFLFIWFIIPYFYITTHMLEYGYAEEDGARLISIIGIFSTIGMVLLGFIGDRPWLNVTKTFSVCLALCGLSVILMPLAVEHYWMLVLLCIVFGITFASSFSFTPSILVTLVDLDDFTCAYGLILLVQGIGSLLGPPLAGVIYDLNGRWDDSFYAAGFFIVISGILAYCVAIIEDREEAEDKEKEKQLIQQIN